MWPGKRSQSRTFPLIPQRMYAGLLSAEGHPQTRGDMEERQSFNEGRMIIGPDTAPAALYEIWKKHRCVMYLENVYTYIYMYI